MTKIETAIVGEIEVSVPTDILDYEMQRAPGETDEELEAAEATYRALFTAALSIRLA